MQRLPIADRPTEGKEARSVHKQSVPDTSSGSTARVRLA